MPRKKYKLKCFRCNHALDKDNVWRDIEGKPICEDCAYEDAMDCDDDEWLFNAVMNAGKDFRNIPLDRCVNGCGELVYHYKDQEPLCPDCQEKREAIET
jgi:formylmethanofuran dehydrogenase subunit E